jgi:hypothetical protein
MRGSEDLDPRRGFPGGIGVSENEIAQTGQLSRRQAISQKRYS